MHANASPRAGFRLALGSTVVALALIVTGCVGEPSTSTTTPSASPDTRTITDAIGEVEVPTEAQTIVALDDYAGMELLALGVKPAKVYSVFASEISTQILTAAGVDVQPATEFQTDPDLEMIAADEPDLLVMSNSGMLPSVRDDLMKIAPTVTVTFSDGWESALEQTAAAVDRDDQAQKVSADIEQKIADTQAMIPADTTVSVLFGYGEDIYMPNSNTVMSQLIEAVGLGRPDVEAADYSSVGRSEISVAAETLGDHAASAEILLTGGYYSVDPIQAQPLFSQLPQVVSGDVSVVDGDTWYGIHPFAIEWILDDLQAIFGGQGTIGTADDAGARWDAFSADLAD